jgi:hypothetical protein
MKRRVRRTKIAADQPERKPWLPMKVQFKPRMIRAPREGATISAAGVVVFFPASGASGCGGCISGSIETPLETDLYVELP